MIKYIQKTILPILLGTTLVSMTMNIYNAGQIVILTIVSFIIQAALFPLLNFLKKRKILGGLIYTLIAFFVAFIFIALWSTSLTGRPPMSFTNWFYGAQDAETYWLPYTLMLLIGLSFFIPSALFYFTQITYRCVIVLLCSLIPFAIYAKRYETPSAFYIAAVLVLFLTLMIHQRQLTDDSVVSLMDKSYWLSVLIFVGIIIFIAMAVPKAEVTPLRQKFDEMVDSLENNPTANVNKVGMFSTESAGSGFDDETTGEILYYVRASEPLYLKIQSYDTYSGERKWSVAKEYYTTGYASWASENSYLNYAYLIDSAKDYSSFSPSAEKFQYTIPESPSNLYEAEIIPNSYSSSYIFTANQTYKMLDEDGNEPKTYMSRHGDLFWGIDIYRSVGYRIFYYSENLDRLKGASAFSGQFSSSDFPEYCEAIKSDEAVSEVSKKVAEAFLNEYEDAYEYYMATYQEPSDEIQALADEITTGCTSDYDKALAIQNYFLKGDYRYSLSFRTNDKSIENFIFKDKTGICADYATAMTILARAAGLPARYTVGYHMYEEMGDDFYVVRDKNAHAFTEVYISGYGWMTFDATPPSVEGDGDNDAASTVDPIRTLVIFVIVIISVVVLITMIIILRPKLNEMFFRIRFSLSGGKKAVILLYTRTGRLLEQKTDFSAKPSTTEEIRVYALGKYSYDISDITYLTEKVCYGNSEVERTELKKGYISYKALCKVIKRYRKEQKKKRR